MSLRKKIITPARHWLADKQTIRQGRQEAKTYGIAYYNFWNLAPTEETWFYRFLQRPAFKGLSSPPPLHFFSVFGRKSLVGKVDGKKVFFTGENLEAHYPAYTDHLLSEADLALGFTDAAAPNQLRFPLWLLDVFPPEADLAVIRTRLAEIDAAGRNLTDRPNFAALIARHDHGGLRTRLADLVAESGTVDYPGFFRHNTPNQLPPGYQAKLDYLRDYRFNLCPENSDAPGYVTEKVWHAHAAGCIPVYWGSGNKPEPSILNPEAILFYDPAFPDRLGERIRRFEAAPAEMADFCQVPRFLPAAADSVYVMFIALEQRLLEVLSK